MINLRTTTMIAALAVICIVGIILVQRIQITSTRARADAADQAAAVSLAEIDRLTAALADAAKKDRIVTQYVDRVQVVRERGETITKEITVLISI